MYHPLDHLFVIVVAVLWPLYALLYEFPRLKRDVAAGKPNARLVVYRKGMALEWGLAAALPDHLSRRFRDGPFGWPQSVQRMTCMAGFDLFQSVRPTGSRPECFQVPALRLQEQTGQRSEYRQLPALQKPV